MAESGEEADRQKVEKPLDQTACRVLGAAEPARPMIDDDLSDPESSRVRQNGHIPVQLAVDAYLVEHFPSIGLEPAVVVVQLAAGQRAHDAVEDTARQDLVPRVVPGLLPAAHDIEPLVELGEEPG